MPFILSKVSTQMTEAQEKEIKTRLGQAISLIPGKSEAYLLCGFESNYLHEKIYDEIVHKLSWLWSSALWQMFDSASDKKQGGLPGTNDKGLISFDHQTKKDVFCFYKANWNHFEPFIHIVAAENTDVVRAYSNYRLLQLYVDDMPFGEPISDAHPDSPVPSGMGIFL